MTNDTPGKIRYAFHVDSRFCTGCKACQIACKDKNGLPAGRLFRRVVEARGGTWARSGPAWIEKTFTYFVSTTCNHCERPICVEVCPSGAMKRRGDDVVLVDAARCLGCRYCEMACPYGAPKYDAAAGVMTKCDFCADELDAGGKPACVAACPMRVLTFGDAAELAARLGGTDEVFPLPRRALTEPSVLITPHRDAAAAEADREGARIGNREEI